VRKLQTPNSKLQRNTKFQAPKLTVWVRFAGLELGISPELGVWSLELLNIFVP